MPPAAPCHCVTVCLIERRRRAGTIDCSSAQDLPNQSVPLSASLIEQQAKTDIHPSPDCLLHTAPTNRMSLRQPASSYLPFTTAVPTPPHLLRTEIKTNPLVVSLLPLSVVCIQVMHCNPSSLSQLKQHPNRHCNISSLPAFGSVKPVALVNTQPRITRSRFSYTRNRSRTFRSLRSWLQITGTTERTLAGRLQLRPMFATHEHLSTLSQS